jgi:hypothetical protein
MSKVKSIPGTRLPEIKVPKAITRYAALYLPEAAYICYENPRTYKLFGSPEKGRRGIVINHRYGHYFYFSNGDTLAMSDNSIASVCHKVDYVKAFTLIKFPNGDKMLKVYINVSSISVFKDNSVLKNADMTYFKDHPERVIYENAV